MSVKLDSTKAKIVLMRVYHALRLIYHENIMLKIFPKIFLPVCICFYGCHNSENIHDYKESTAHTQFVDISKTEESGLNSTLNQFFDSWRIIQLETNKNCLIGKIEKIIVQPDRLYIMDSNIAESVFIFDREGNWINTIHRKGRGPGEYVDFTDIEYDMNTQQICMLCGTKIMIFDRDGAYLSSVNVAFVPEKISIVDDCFVISTIVRKLPKFTSDLIICDKNFKVVNQYFPRPKEWNSMSSRSGSPLSTFQSNIYYFPGNNTYVYNITKDSATAKYWYDFGNYNLIEKLKAPMHTRELVAAKQRYVNDLSFFQETDQYFIISVILKGRNILIFHSKENQQITSYYLHNHPFVSRGFGRIEGITKDYVITSIDADVALQSIQDENGWFKEKNPEGWEFYKNQFKRPLKEDDNPVLYFFKLK